MRISLADGMLNGFKKWSDGRRPKSGLATTAAGPTQAEQRTPAVRKPVVRKQDASHGTE